MPPTLAGALKRTLTAAVAAALAGCSTFGALNATAPRGGVKVERDIAYAEGERRGLDVYAPKAVQPGGRPVVVFFYGGSWEFGSKADYAWVGSALARAGYVAVLPDYRLYPEARWPQFLQDSALAVKWARDHAGAYGGDPRRLVLMGHSAGAYNAVTLTVDRRWLAEVGLDPARDVRAAVGLSGPYDFLPLRSRTLMDIFGPEAARPDTQPINHVDGRAPPLLLATGDRDVVVDPGNSDRLAARVRAAGGTAQVIHYPKLDHARTAGALAERLRFLAPVMRDVRRFIDGRTAPVEPLTPAG